MAKSWKPDRMQELILLQANKYGGVFYPHPELWDEVSGKFVSVHGSGTAAKIKALWRRDLMTPQPSLQEYACKLTESGRELATAIKDRDAAAIKARERSAV